MIVWTLIAMIAAWAGFRLFGGYPAPEASLEVLAPREAAFLDAAAEAMFPAVDVLPISGREAELPRYVDRWLVLLPPRQKFLIRALLFLVEQATIFFPAPGPSLRRFSSLSPPAREAWLRAWGESGLGLRRLVFTSLRAVLTMGYLGHPAVLRHVHLAPLEIKTPIGPSEWLYPRAGYPPSSIEYSEADRTPPSDGTPLDLRGLLHPDYRAPEA